LPLGALLRRADARWLLAFGTILIGVACLMATNLTSQWATDDFLPSQILQAIGQSFALTALIVLIVQSIHPADALTIGSLLQISRLFGGERCRPECGWNLVARSPARKGIRLLISVQNRFRVEEASA